MNTTHTTSPTPPERELQILRHLAQHAPRPDLRSYYRLLAEDCAERLRKARQNGKERRPW
jgi:hypothetical protein